MNTTESWRSLFENWPDSIPCQGTIITRTGDAIPFSSFLIADALLLLERARPDALGNRKVMLAYESIGAVTFTSGAPLSQFQCMGFQPTF